MALIFANRGASFAFQQRGSKIVNLPGFPGNGAGPYPIFATNVQAMDEDIIGRVVCLNDKRILFDFGKGFGDFTMQGEVLMGNNEGGEISGNVGEVAAFWNSRRVSQYKQAITLTLAGSQTATNLNFMFFLHRAQIGPIQAEINVCMFQLVGTLVRMW